MGVDCSVEIDLRTRFDAPAETANRFVHFLGASTIRRNQTLAVRQRLSLRSGSGRHELAAAAEQRHMTWRGEGAVVER